MRNEGLGSAASEIAEEFVLMTPQSIPMEWTEQPEDQQVWNTLAKMENSMDKEEEDKKEKSVIISRLMMLYQRWY